MNKTTMKILYRTLHILAYITTITVIIPLLCYILFGIDWIEDVIEALSERGER